MLGIARIVSEPADVGRQIPRHVVEEAGGLQNLRTFRLGPNLKIHRRCDDRRVRRPVNGRRGFKTVKFTSVKCGGRDVHSESGGEFSMDAALEVHPSVAGYRDQYDLVEIDDGDGQCCWAVPDAFVIRASVFGEIVVDIIYDVLESFAAPNPEMSLANIQNEIADEIARRIADGELIEDRIPARSTISTYAKKLNQYEIVRLTEGTYEADRQFQPKGKIIIPDFPHSRWEIDHTLLPIKVAFRFTDYHGVEQTVIVGKVWCTAIIDVSTKYILALVFGIDPPSSLRTMQALRMAVTPKSGMFIEYGIDNRLDICMLPVCAVMDNGKDLHSNTVASAMSDLGITQVFAGVYRGDHKPHIERFFRSFKAFLRKVHGSTPKGLPKGGPKRRDAQPAEPMTLQQLERFGWKWTSDTYHIRPHAGLHNESPLNVMTSGIRRLQAERNRATLLRFVRSANTPRWTSKRCSP